MGSRHGALLAVADLHVEHAENRALVEAIEPGADGDWLLVAGDVAERPEDVEWALGLLAERFARVVWAPGNHELLAQRDEPPELRGERRYLRLVEICRRLGVLTPEDPYPIWDGPGGPLRVVPTFLLYDYSFGTGTDRADSLRRAEAAGVVCADEFLLDPDPYPSREAWCAARVSATEARLLDLEPVLPAVFVNHYPLLAAPTAALRHPEFAQWCGTQRTADWHRRFRAAAVVHGHLHIPRTTWHDGVRFEEVSLGYPRERRRWPSWPPVPRRLLPEERRA